MKFVTWILFGPSKFVLTLVSLLKVIITKLIQAHGKNVNYYSVLKVEISIYRTQSYNTACF